MTLATVCAILRTDIVAVVGEPAGGDAPLRFFTTEGPHAGAGHSTLAAAHIVLRGGWPTARARGALITFHLDANGERRTAHVEGERIAVDFPAMPGTSASTASRRWRRPSARARRRPGSPPSAMSRSSTIAAVIAGMRPDMALVSRPSIAMP